MAEHDETEKEQGSAKVELDPQIIEDLDVGEDEAAKVVGGMMIIDPSASTELLA